MSESETANPSLFEAIEARLMDEARAKIKRDLAEFARLAEAYPDAVKAIAGQFGLTAPASPQPPIEEKKLAPIETLGDLIVQYQTASNSPFQKLKHVSKAHYQTIMGMIDRDHGSARLADVYGDTLDDWYASWKDGGKVAMSQSKMKILQTLVGFGTTMRDDNCARVFGLIQKMEIESPKIRNEYLTHDLADKIRAMAHEKQRPSIALAQAFQSSADLTQKDVVGEWVPMSEAGISVIFSKGLKWVRGIRWDEIDQNLILTHLSGDKQITRDLKKAPMVLQELDLIKATNGGVLPSKGPIIVSEFDNLPWDAVEFRRWWRMLANACGIPKNVKNSDSRVKAGVEAAEGSTMNENKGGLF
ncbi:MAG TPA: hypothetical protein VNY08_05880 [Bradyrhizobium sp.]|jgi:hypothetical protein|nr:hypothetical protein [Bradyrhizobium sp.]